MENMIITKTFVNEEAVLRDAINSLPVIDCIERFFDYIESHPEGELEKEYVNALHKKRVGFVEKIYKDTLANLTMEQLKDMLFEQAWDGLWALYDRDNHELVEYIKYDHTDADLYEYIKKLMNDTLDEVITKKTKLANEQKIDNLKARYESNKNSYERIAKEQADLKEELKKLGVEV